MTEIFKKKLEVNLSWLLLHHWHIDFKLLLSQRLSPLTFDQYTNRKFNCHSNWKWDVQEKKKVVVAIAKWYFHEQNLARNGIPWILETTWKQAINERLKVHEMKQLY